MSSPYTVDNYNWTTACYDTGNLCTYALKCHACYSPSYVL